MVILEQVHPDGPVNHHDGSVGGDGAGAIQAAGRLVVDIVSAYEESARSLWKCAEYTWRLFEEHGMYERQWTETLCNELAVNKDTIYHWRKAWEIRQRIGYYEGLTISHYYHAADYSDRMDDSFLAEFLEAARDAKMSVRSFANELEMATNESGTLPWLTSKLKQYLQKIQGLYHSAETSGLSDYKRERLKEAIRIIEDVLK